jgi:hypothetical protein
MPSDDERFPAPTDEDKRRVRDLLHEVGGPNVQWGAVNVLEVLKLEHQMRAERMATKRIERVTWVLAGATVVLALATIGLIIATLST